MIRIHKNLFPVNKYQHTGFETADLSERQKKFINHFNDQVREGKIAFETQNCICGFNEFDLIASVDSNSLLQSISVCRKCGLIQANPRMTPIEYKNFYESDFYNDVYHRENLIDYSRIKLNQYTGKKIFERVSRYITITKETKVLEIGAEAGWNLLQFINAGATVVGVEYSQKFVEIAHQFGLNIKQGDYTQIEGKYDVIILSHIIEHLLNPIEDLKRISTKLAPNGIIYISTVNILNFEHSQFQNARTYYFTPLNIEYFCSKASLKQINCGVSEYNNMYGIYSVDENIDMDDKYLKINRKLIFRKLYIASLSERISGLFFVVKKIFKKTVNTVKYLNSPNENI